MPFSNLGLHPDVVRGVKAMGFTDPTPIQLQAIPLLLKGEDIMACAQTGSGKTAAFALPILQRLLEQPRPGLRALIIVPTRELAAQVETTLRDCGRFTPFKVALVIGGVGYHGQRQAFAAGAPIVVATPGRLLDHLKQGGVRLNQVELLVLDEADRMLDMGFLPAIRDILGRLPRQRQTMLFSATLAPEIERIAAFALRNPRRVEISRPSSVAEGISQVVYPISQQQKTQLLMALLEATQIRSGVIFCRTKHGADRLSQRLKENGLSIGVLHANRTQGQRTAAMDNFREGRTQILVATDIAARGIDVREISHVINYDLPRHPEDYVHRVGRTARAYGVGDAITLMSPEEQSFLSAIERFVGLVFPRAMLPNFPYTVAPLLKAPRPKTFRDMNWSRFRRITRRR
ncbi:MAG: RNA helicase [Elusimicrobia bacterium RIFCSPHIGHO2_02_FULL_57_9]|nr:MAG: RNA helicase [Elusimicrobia bacterium RIFCSPHIGHO2_02_FULL_57_9]